MKVLYTETGGCYFDNRYNGSLHNNIYADVPQNPFLVDVITKDKIVEYYNANLVNLLMRHKDITSESTSSVFFFKYKKSFAYEILTGKEGNSYLQLSNTASDIAYNTSFTIFASVNFIERTATKKDEFLEIIGTMHAYETPINFGIFESDKSTENSINLTIGYLQDDDATNFFETDTPSVPINTDVIIVFTKSSDDFQIFLFYNNSYSKKKISISQSISTYYTTETLYVGKKGAKKNSHFLFSSAIVYNRVLSDSEIIANCKFLKNSIEGSS
jgi:hypothetical protein